VTAQQAPGPGAATSQPDGVPSASGETTEQQGDMSQPQRHAVAQLSDPTQDPAIRAEILRLRASIDNIDAALVHLLAERFKCTERVGELKAQGGVAPADPVRESQQIERLGGIARESGLDQGFAEEFRSFIVSEVVRRHAAIAAERGAEPVLDTYS
jgi:chorismate mutase